MAKGRPRLTPEEYESRLRAYCAKYSVKPNAEGLPPFPAGRRETPQHREWMKLYKVHNRMARRSRGQCERCGTAVSDGSIFCETHRAANSAVTGGHAASADERRALLDAQGSRCPICGETVDLWDSVDHCHRTRAVRALIHQRCNQLVGAAESLGPDALDRVKQYLWTTVTKRSNRRT
jgi:ribosomal protein S27AE